MKREGLVKMRLHLDLQSPSWSPKDTRPLESDTHLLVAYIFETTQEDCAFH
jgi:hypothetical protein